jgi:glyoxylase-like metal-dependent hydrolase (beta-lactamase superfamily II)
VTSFASFGRTVDLFGDGAIRLLSTPGHSPGHMSVLLSLESGRELLITADAAYSQRTIDEDLLPVFVDDVHRYRRSLREIRRYVEQTPGAEVICGHDAEAWPQVRETYR